MCHEQEEKDCGENGKELYLLMNVKSCRKSYDVYVGDDPAKIRYSSVYVQVRHMK